MEGLPTTRPKLYYQYYRKQVSNWQLIPALSAMPTTIKRTALTQYGLRILRNSKLELEWETKAKMLSTFSERMRDSGYGEKFRLEIISSILVGWKKMVTAQEEGLRPINRSRSWNQGEREEKKWRKQATWYKQGGYTTVIFCPYTPNSTLANRWREAEARGADTRGWRYRVVELGGRSVRSRLCRFPWGVPCTDPVRCMVCSTSGRGSCTSPGCTYKVQCLACRDRGPDTVPLEEEVEGERRPGQGQVGVPCTSLYHGESGYSAFTRGLDHQADLVKGEKTNAMVRHTSLYHQGKENDVEYSMSVVSTNMDPLTRKIEEGVSIISNQQDILLNSKQEFLQGAVPNTRVQRGFGR